MNLEPGTLVVVATGTTARMFKSEGRGKAQSLAAHSHLEPQNLLDDGPAGKRPTESSARETDEATFSKQLANHLNALALRQQYDALVLIADPQTLGEVRRSLHKEVQNRLVAEIAKTLIGHTSEQITKIISAE
ncbi:MAG: host attachment family protein [Hyphomicrobiaceae bacterium]